MLNRFDVKLTCAEIADAAQNLRGSDAFGAVAFSERAHLRADRVALRLGYADCLLIRSGGFWCDPRRLIVQEMAK